MKKRKYPHSFNHLFSGNIEPSLNHRRTSAVDHHFLFRSPVSATLTPPVPKLPLLLSISSPPIVASMLSGELVLFGPRLASVACMMLGDGGCLSATLVAHGSFVSSPPVCTLLGGAWPRSPPDGGKFAGGGARAVKGVSIGGKRPAGNPPGFPPGPGGAGDLAQGALVVASELAPIAGGGAGFLAQGAAVTGAGTLVDPGRDPDGRGPDSVG